MTDLGHESRLRCAVGEAMNDQGAESVKLGVPTRESNGSREFEVEIVVVLRIEVCAGRV
jgi:hypothetical protein